MRNEEKIAYLRSPAGSALLEEVCASSEDDLTLARSARLAGLEAGLRAALLEQRGLRIKARGKFPDADRMLFTKLGLEQATHHLLARHKAERLADRFPVVADLCCGLGGDSLALRPEVKVVGVDFDRGTLLAFRHNLAVGRGGANVVLADAGASPVRAAAVLLDPARRAKGSDERWSGDDLSPGWERIREIIARFGNVALKLGPGAQLPEFLLEHELEYLGLEDQCLELVVWTGELGRRGWVRATELPVGESLTAPAADLADTFDRVEEPGPYLFEPVKAVVRAHLFGVLSQSLGLWQLDPRIAYLSGAGPVFHPLLKSYEVLAEAPLQPKAIQPLLRERGIGTLDIKKRGVDITPEELRRKLKLEGPERATLIATRAQGRRMAFLVRPLRQPDVEPPFSPRS